MLKNPARRTAALAVLAPLAALALPAPPAGATSLLPPVTALVSASPSGPTANGTSLDSSVSTGGRFVAFSSAASDVVAGDTNGKGDIFVRDTLTATTVRASIGNDSAQANGASDQPSISRDGRYLAFRSDATNLVAGDTNGVSDIFVRDLRNKTTTRANVAGGSNAQATGGGSSKPKISGGGLQVAFESTATNLLPTDTNGVSDVFVRDADLGTTELVSLTSAEATLAQGSTTPAISGTGRYVLFTSMTNQIGTFTDSYNDVFLRDRALGTTERVSLAGDSSHPDGLSDNGSVSDDGRFIAFKSMATNLSMDTDAPGVTDVFRRDRSFGSTELIDQSTGFVTANAGGTSPTMSADGTKVAFLSSATNLVAGDTNGGTDIFVRDLGANVTTRASLTTPGAQLSGSSSLPSISSDGVAIGFTTTATNTSTTDGNSTLDVFVRSRYEIGPYAGSDGLVEHSIIDFTGATPTPAAIAAANKKILNGTASPASTINALAHGPFDDHRGPVLRLYWAFFKRAPDLGGLTYWAGKHAKGTSLKTIANGFATSSEFKTNFGGGTDTQFVTLVYTNVLERQPDAAGLAHWVNKMKAGTTRGEMLINFSESSEGIRKMRGETDTALVILGMLHRAPSTGEVISYANALELQGGQPTEALIQTLLTGSEYKTHVN